MLLTNKLVTDLLIALITLIIACFFYVKHKYNYWIRKGVVQIPPVFPFGNYLRGLPRGISLGAHSVTFYNELKKRGEKYGGVYLGLDPYLVIIDTSLAKTILTKDFSHFVDRGLYRDEKNPITVNILTQGGDEWKMARSKFTNIFTSAKMKYFFDTVKKCSDELKGNLELIESRNEDIDIYEVMACYFTDVIGSVTYGVEANSFKHPDAIFRKLGRDLFVAFSLPFQINLFLTICYPKVAKFFKVVNFQKEIQGFFDKFVPEALETRKKNGIYRADFLQLLIEMKESGVKLTTEEIVSQSFMFFSAGFETSSATSMLTLYEISKNKEIQDKLREEIKAIFEKYAGNLTYESLKEMTYLQQVLNETMRKYPLLTTLNRTCVKDYKIPDSDVVIEKDTGIILPVLGYHRDPAVFVDPEAFIPERFTDPNVKYEGYFPFGDGPRSCIGARFGLMQIKLGLAEIIKNYELSLSPKMKEPLDFDHHTFVTKMTHKVYLKIKKIDA